MYWTIGLAMDDKTSTPHVTIGPAMRMYMYENNVYFSISNSCIRLKENK